MSRASEARSAKWKAQKSLRMAQEAALAAMIAEAEDPEVTAARKASLVPVVECHNYNLHPTLLQAIKGAPYTRKRSSTLQSFPDILDEIYNEVGNLEPFEKGTTRASSVTFSILYRLFELGLTQKQMRAMLTHEDSPYIRCIAVLYLRYLVRCPIVQLAC